MSIEADIRNLAKWLNEEQTAPIERQALARILAHVQTPQEPFGYFRPEPFGWTDCAEGDEGAVALYDKPQGAVIVWAVFAENGNIRMFTTGEQHAKEFAASIGSEAIPLRK